MDDKKRPSWMPPPLVFPIVWSSIGLLRCISSVLVWEASGRDLLAAPLIVFCFHLAVGDCWNHVSFCRCSLITCMVFSIKSQQTELERASDCLQINNVEKRVGVAVPVSRHALYVDILSSTRLLFALHTE